MARLSFASALSTLTYVSTTLAHMQMINPSPFRDPQANRQDEPKDWNILMPLRTDGSDFACKGYQWNTPWTPTATYEAGKTYDMELKGGATHGGGSCQLSMSFDRGVTFRVIKSIEGGCPEKKKYSFTVPAELGEAVGSQRTTGLFAWTWFNRIGNREMYMNCAAVDIIPSGSSKHHDRHTILNKINARDASQTNAAAQAALSPYPKLFVANLKGINDCVTKETVDVIFDSPGDDVAFAGKENASAEPSFRKEECTGQGIKSAPSSSSPWSAPTSSPGGSSPGDDGQWHGGSGHQQPQSTNQAGTSSNCNDGQYHKECFEKSDKQAAPPVTKDQAHLKGLIGIPTGKDRSPQLEKEVNAYLENLYGEKRSTGRATCESITTDVKRCRKPNRWVKTAACTWNCSRKSQVAKKPAVRVEFKRIARKLAALQKQMAKLTTIVTKIKMRKGRVTKRQEATAEQSDVPDTQMENTIAINDPTLHLFLLYLERLRDKVIECTRYVEAATPADPPIASIESASSDISAPLMEDDDIFEQSSTLQELEADVDEYLQQLKDSNSDTDPLPTSHEAAGTIKRQLVPITSEALPTFAFYEYASILSDTITTAIGTWLDGIGPLVHDIAAQLQSYDSPTWYNDTSLPLGNYSSYPTHEVTDALNGWLEELKVIVDEGVKQSLEGPPPPIEGKPAIYPTNSEGRVPFYPQPSDPKPIYPFYANTTEGIINSTTSHSIYSTDPAPVSTTTTPPPPTTSDQEAQDPIDEADKQHALDDFLAALGPGPVIPPGINIDWPGPNHPGEGNLEDMPTIVNDLGPGSEEEVRKFFEELDKKYGGGEDEEDDESEEGADEDEDESEEADESEEDTIESSALAGGEMAAIDWGLNGKDKVL